MSMLRITTGNDSHYLVGPSPVVPGHVRIARLAERPVFGVAGPPSFATDVAAAELVTEDGELRLRWTEHGTTIRTSAIRDVAAWRAVDVESTPV